MFPGKIKMEIQLHYHPQQDKPANGETGKGWLLKKEHIPIDRKEGKI